MDHTCVGLAPKTGKTRTSIYILPAGNILKNGCGRLRPPTCGNTISTIFAD